VNLRTSEEKADKDSKMMNCGSGVSAAALVYNNSSSGGVSFDVDWNLDLGDGEKLDMEDLLTNSTNELSTDSQQQQQQQQPSVHKMIAQQQREPHEMVGKKGDRRNTIHSQLLSITDDTQEDGSVRYNDDNFQRRKNRAFRGPSRRSGKKKPKGMPKRPLSAYNIFFQQERLRVYEQSNLSGYRVTFEDLGKEIGMRWRNLSEKDRKQYDQLAGKEIERYRQERDTFEETRRRRLDGSLAKYDDEINCHKKHDLFKGLDQDDQSLSVHTPLTALPPLSSFKKVELLPGLQGRIVEAPSYAAVSYSSITVQPYHLPGYEPMFVSAPAASGSATTRELPNVHFPSSMPPPVAIAPELLCSDALPIPPGMQVVLPDQNGRDTVFTVSYTCYKMTQEEADHYIRSLSQPHPPSTDGNSRSFCSNAPSPDPHC